jgi:hypothetical protein
MPLACKAPHALFADFLSAKNGPSRILICKKWTVLRAICYSACLQGPLRALFPDPYLEKMHPYLEKMKLFKASYTVDGRK